MKTIFGMLILMGTLFAHAGEKGNGGDAVVCRDKNGEIISAELLDYYEGRTLRGLNVPNYQVSDEQLFGDLQAILTKMDLGTFYGFEESLQLLKSLRNHLSGSVTGEAGPTIKFTSDPLTDIPDSDELILKEGCKVEQLVIHTLTTFPEDPEYIVQEKILQKLDDVSLRGIAIHEILYKLMIQRGAGLGYSVENSISTRYLHQKLMSNKDNFSSYDYINVLSASCGKNCPAEAIAPSGISCSPKTLRKFDGPDGKPLLRIYSDTEFIIYVLKNDSFEIDVDRTNKYGSAYIAAAYYRSLDFDPKNSGITVEVTRASSGATAKLTAQESEHIRSYVDFGFGEWDVTINVLKAEQQFAAGLTTQKKLNLFSMIMPSTGPSQTMMKVKVFLNKHFGLSAQIIQ